jgi:hypothetical protein
MGRKGLIIEKKRSEDVPDYLRRANDALLAEPGGERFVSLDEKPVNFHGQVRMDIQRECATQQGEIIGRILSGKMDPLNCPRIALAGAIGVRLIFGNEERLVFPQRLFSPLFSPIQFIPTLARGADYQDVLFRAFLPLPVMLPGLRIPANVRGVEPGNENVLGRAGEHRPGNDVLNLALKPLPLFGSVHAAQVQIKVNWATDKLNTYGWEAMQAPVDNGLIKIDVIISGYNK